MAIGIPINPGLMNSQAGQIAIDLRNANQAVLNLQANLVSVGHDELVLAGFTDADATALMTVINQLNTIALVYFGQATQGSQFNFNTASSGLTGGG